MANLLQGSKSTFSCARFPRFFAFQAGMWGTLISALLNSPTVSGGFLRLSPAQNDLPLDTVDSGFGIDLAATEVSGA